MSFPKFPFPKDPDEVLDYQINWASKLPEGDTIVTSQYSVIDDGDPDGNGVTIDSQSIDGSLSIVWLSGGLNGSTATIRCRITTDGGRQMDQTVQLKIKTK